MTIIKYFSKEFYFKIIYLILIFVSLIILIITKAKTFLLYILEPIKEIKINNFITNYQNNKIDYNNFYSTENTNEIFIPIIEINLPFFTTSYIFLKYILLFSIYLFIPIVLYYIYISISSMLKKEELFSFRLLLYIILIYIYINFIINHYIIVPIFLNFIYSHYTEFLYYEFDVEFQLITYLDFYFYSLFSNFFLFVIILLKKYLKLNIPNILILVGIIMIIPFDGIIQIIYIIIFIIYTLISLFITNYISNIKKNQY
jgi:hypothetical protein